ncbi:MAG TPA: VCBS repeat-containing protein, partial [Herpetosiphonaceae bacterium]|nr:VCBS repeat-containing protein [Herpetosiphonaceae bacterium]
MILPILAGCGRTSEQVALAGALLSDRAPRPARVIPVRVQTAALSKPAEPCTNTFIAHDLDHTTTAGGIVKMYASNGAGLGIGDLDGDGRLDIVLANLTGGNTILWNEGNFHFRKEILDDGPSRSVNVVDVDGDGWLDIVFTHSTTAPTYWHNTGRRANGVHFVQEPLPGIDERSYAMTWGDPHGAGRLDAVAGSYDVDLEQTYGFQFMHFRDGGG